MKAWWKESVVYQIYPRSFCDSNGDGIGDLQGIVGKLDYLKTLGVDVIWLSPVYKSPNDDNGYDISNYRDVMDEFGTLADLDALLAGLHARGMKLMMDLVVNHTSDEHPWFVEAKKGKDNPYRNYYIWRDAKPDGSEPNNWVSFFSGSTWEWDSASQQYYLHLFSKKQPDLNWENPKVRTEVFEMMHWWLKRGIDGFRMDVINMISKQPGLPDAPVTAPGQRFQFPGDKSINGPRLLEFLQEMKDEVLSKYDIFTVGEAPTVTTEHGVQMTHHETGKLNMLFQFEHMDLDSQGSKWDLKQLDLLDLKASMTRWQKDLEDKGWNSLYLSNHDQPRPVSRFGDDSPEYRVVSAKMLGTFLHLLQGTPYVYQGEELGMTNVHFESIEDYQDIEIRNMWREAVVEQGQDAAQVLASIHAKGRDNARTPIPWDDGPNAGFTSGTPWLKLNPNDLEFNAKQALADPDSVFHYYQRLIALRKANPVMVYGRYDLILADHAEIYAYTRTLGDDRLLVMLNFGPDRPTFNLPGDLKFAEKQLVIGNYPADASQDIGSFALRPYEARVYRLR